jgi:hypothetical protein
MLQALEAARAHNPAAVARSLTAACCRVLNEADGGLEGPAFACLQYFFLFAGQAGPRLLTNDCNEGPGISCQGIDDEKAKKTVLRESLLQSLWSLVEAFIQARTRLRKPEFDHRHGATALEAAAVRFFPFFTSVWPWIQVSTASELMAIYLAIEVYVVVSEYYSWS